MHCPADFNVDETTSSDFGSKVVVNDDAGREIGRGFAHVFNWSRGVLRYMLEMSMPIHFAWGLLRWVFMVLRPAALVLVSSE